MGIFTNVNRTVDVFASTVLDDCLRNRRDVILAGLADAEVAEVMVCDVLP